MKIVFIKISKLIVLKSSMLNVLHSIIDSFHLKHYRGSWLPSFFIFNHLAVIYKNYISHQTLFWTLEEIFLKFIINIWFIDFIFVKQQKLPKMHIKSFHSSNFTPNNKWDHLLFIQFLPKLKFNYDL
jgi:hypothetical protein